MAVSDSFASRMLHVVLWPWKIVLIQKITVWLCWGLCAFSLWCMFVRTPGHELDAARRSAARRAADAAIEAMSKDEVRGSMHVVRVLHFGNDPSHYVTDQFRKGVSRQGGFTLCTDKRLLDCLRAMIGLGELEVEERDNAISIAKGDADAVLWGVVDRLEHRTDGVAISGMYELYDLKGERVAYSGRLDSVFSSLPGFVPQRVSKDAGCMPWHARFLWFIVVTLLLPVLTISFIRIMVAKRSNRVNSFVLGIYTVIDAILAFFMVGGRLSSLFEFAVFLPAVVLAFLYNIQIMTFAVRLEK